MVILIPGCAVADCEGGEAARSEAEHETETLASLP